MSSQSPFEVIRWDAPKPPTPSFLSRWLEREGLSAREEIHAAGSISPEIKFEAPMVRVVVSGNIQVSFPGYGVVELNPGDRLDVEAHFLHDMTVSSMEPAITLVATP